MGKNQEFINKLLLKRKIIKQDLNKINWSNLKLFKSQSTNNDPINKSVTITQKVMKEYCNIALERLNTSNKNTSNNNNNNLIPIVVIDKHHNWYGIEWVLIVHIIHRNCDVGISFRYDAKSNVFVATAIYLDKVEIESKHKLIGLKFDYCKHLRPFSLRKFKFKSDRHSIIDDDDVAIHNNGDSANGNYQQIQQQMISYKKAYQAEQIKNQRLQQQLQQNNQMYSSQINSLKQDNQMQQYIMQQQLQQQQMQQSMDQSMNQQQPMAYQQQYAQFNQYQQGGYSGYTG